MKKQDWEKELREIVKKWQYKDGYIHLDDMVEDIVELFLSTLSRQRKELIGEVEKEIDFYYKVYKKGKGKATLEEMIRLRLDQLKILNEEEK